MCFFFFLSTSVDRKWDIAPLFYRLSFLQPSVGECWAVMFCGLHVDLGTVTSIYLVGGLVAASRLLFYLYNRITSTVQKKKRKKRLQSAVPAPSCFIQPFRQVLGVWFIGCWVLPASVVHTSADILPLGDTQPWNFLLVSQELSIGHAFV